MNPNTHGPRGGAEFKRRRASARRAASSDGDRWEEHARGLRPGVAYRGRAAGSGVTGGQNSRGHHAHSQFIEASIESAQDLSFVDDVHTSLEMGVRLGLTRPSHVLPHLRGRPGPSGLSPIPTGSGCRPRLRRRGGVRTARHLRLGSATCAWIVPLPPLATPRRTPVESSAQQHGSVQLTRSSSPGILPLKTIGGRRSPSYARCGRLSPSLARRVSSVVGLDPSRSAAPPGPRTRQPALSSTLRM